MRDNFLFEFFRFYNLWAVLKVLTSFAFKIKS